MSLIEHKLKSFRNYIKDNIVTIVRQMYLEENNYIYPNFENDEEYTFDKFQKSQIKVETILVDDDNIPYTSYEVSSVRKCMVTLDSNLFIQVNCLVGEIHWEELSTDELADILHELQTMYYSRKVNC